MAHLQLTSLAAEPPGDVQQATQITTEDGIGIGRGDILDFGCDHPLRDLRILDAEQPAEPAARIPVLQFTDGQSVHPIKQLPRLWANAHLAEARA